MPLGPVPLGANGIEVSAAILGLGEVVDVRVAYPDAQSHRLAYLAVQAEGHGWHTLDPAQSLAIPVRRDNRFTPPRLRHRTRHVARDDGGRTQVMAESAWRDHAGEALVVDV